MLMLRRKEPMEHSATSRVLKIGATYQREKINGVWVNTVYASNFDSVICTLMGTNTKIEHKAEERTFDVGIPYNRPDT